MSITELIVFLVVEGEWQLVNPTLYYSGRGRCSLFRPAATSLHAISVPSLQLQVSNLLQKIRISLECDISEIVTLAANVSCDLLLGNTHIIRLYTLCLHTQYCVVE